MKKLRFWIVFLLISSMLFASCTSPTGDGGTTAGDESTTDEGTTDSEETTSKELRILFGGEGESYKLVCANGLNDIWDFPLLLQEKTGLMHNMMFEIESDGGTEILIGNATTREESVAVYEETPYDGYTVRFSGDKLLIVANSSDLLRKAFQEMIEALEQNEEGAWGLPMDFQIEVRNSSVVDPIPKVNSVGVNSGVYDCGYGSYQLCYSGAGSADFDDYLLALSEAGFSEYTQNTIGTNRFATYVTENTVVRVCWYNALSALHILYGPRGYLPATSLQAPKNANQVTPTVTQIGRTGATQGAAGMSYIVQLTDGSFIVIDGGPFDAQDTQKLMAFLNARKPESDEKPRITWMISHLHSDHVDLSFDFLKKYRENIDLEMFCWSVPNYENVTITDEATSNSLAYQKAYDELLAEYYPDTIRYTFNAGDRMFLPGCDIEFLCTYNCLWPDEIGSINDTSAMWRMTFESGYTFLVTGDTYPANCNFVCKVYGNLMKSDMVQTPHHGRVGSTLEFYRKVQADIILWSNAAKFLHKSDAYKTAYDFPCNAEIIDDTSLQHYHSESTTIIDMNTLKATVYDTFIWGDGSASGDVNKTEGATFTASDSYTVSKHLEKAPLTVEAFLTLPKTLSGRGGVIFGNYKVSGGECYGVEIFNNGVPRLYIITSGTGKKTVDVKFEGVDIRSDDGPVHLAITLDVAGGKANCYVNGELKKSASVNLTGTLTSPNKHMVGGDLRDGNSQYFKGTLYSLVAYADVRTAAEIKSDAAKMDTEDEALLVAYDFSVKSEEKWKDLSSNANHLQ